MAKDGTNRGGARPGAGRPRKALTEKIAEGKSAEVMMQPTDIESAETPPVREFMQELQRDGTKLLADEVYTETYQWLKERSCEKIVSRQLVEQYAMSISRWIHCEQIVTKYGYISKHPTTGAAIASPYVAMSQNYMKQANQIWNFSFSSSDIFTVYSFEISSGIFKWSTAFMETVMSDIFSYILSSASGRGL